MLVLAANRPAATAPTAAPPEASLTISVAPTTVTLADGTTVTLVDPAPRQLLTPQQTGPGVVTWTGLLGALALIATALVAAAATCFMLYVRPVLQVSHAAAALAVHQSACTCLLKQNPFHAAVLSVCFMQQQWPQSAHILSCQYRLGCSVSLVLLIVLRCVSSVDLLPCRR